MMTLKPAPVDAMYKHAKRPEMSITHRSPFMKPLISPYLADGVTVTEHHADYVSVRRRERDDSLPFDNIRDANERRKISWSKLNSVTEKCAIILEPFVAIYRETRDVIELAFHDYVKFTREI